MHTKLIHLQYWIKCNRTVNNGNSCNLENINEIESQTNGDVDLLTLGHIIMWGMVAYVEPKVTLPLVCIVSIGWEIIEVFMGNFGFPIHGRITDIFMNLYGFLIGYSLRNKHS